MDADLSEAMCYLVSGRGHNFYARILAGLQSEATKRVSSMGVMLQQRSMQLQYNPEWIASAEFDDVVATIEHEALHVVLEHIPRKLVRAAMAQKPEDRKAFFRCTPIAEDMAVNCLLIKSNEFVEKHPDEWVLPDQEAFKLPRDKTYEWYLDELIRRYKSDPEFRVTLDAAYAEMLKQMGPSANHAGWDQILAGSSDEEKHGLANELKHQTSEIVKKAVADQAKSRGTFPSFLTEFIDKLLAPPRVSWIQLLRDRVINTRRWKWSRSVTRPNRRHVGVPSLIPFPGKRKEKTFTVVFCIDTSGSMGTRELEIALNELQHLQKVDRDIEITVIESDAAIGREYTVKYDTAVKPDMTGRGGTNFNPALQRAKELKPDITLYYTDGYAPAPDTRNRVACPMVWLISPRGTIPDPEWGYTLQMVDR